MIVDTPLLNKVNKNPHIISFLNRNGCLERTLSGTDVNEGAGFVNVKDIEVDDVENIYVLDGNSKVYVFKQKKLMY